MRDISIVGDMIFTDQQVRLCDLAITAPFTELVTFSSAQLSSAQLSSAQQLNETHKRIRVCLVSFPEVMGSALSWSSAVSSSI